MTMNEQLIGYLLNALDPDDHRRTEQYLAENAEARLQLDVLRRALAPLECDRAQPMPPPGLVERTMSRLSGSFQPRPAASRAAPREFVHAPTRWRRIDVFVAAGIMILIGGLGTSGLARLYEHRERVRCQDNMRRYYQSFVNYADTHEGALPAVTDQPPYNKAGSFVPQLQKSGQLAPQVFIDCPAGIRANAAPVYSYPLGYRDAAGRLCGVRLGAAQGDPAVTPILADREDARLHGRGFNVLNLGGDVRFHTDPRIGIDRDHIFMNAENRVKAGLHPRDSVLAPGETPP